MAYVLAASSVGLRVLQHSCTVDNKWLSFDACSGEGD